VDTPRIDVAAQVFVDSSVWPLTFGPQTKINPHRNRTDLTTTLLRLFTMKATTLTQRS
jgi:hypothetical protein